MIYVPKLDVAGSNPVSCSNVSRLYANNGADPDPNHPHSTLTRLLGGTLTNARATAALFARRHDFAFRMLIPSAPLLLSLNDILPSVFSDEGQYGKAIARTPATPYAPDYSFPRGRFETTSMGGSPTIS